MSTSVSVLSRDQQESLRQQFQELEPTDWVVAVARQDGWYGALDLRPIDSVISESEWGDEACEALIEFS